MEEDVAVTENHVEERNVSKPEPSAPKQANSYSSGSLTRDSQSNIVPVKQDVVPAKVDVIPVRMDIVPVKKDVVPPKEEVVPSKEDVAPKKVCQEPQDVSLPKPVPVDVASVNPVPTSHPPAAQGKLAVVLRNNDRSKRRRSCKRPAFVSSIGSIAEADGGEMSAVAEQSLTPKLSIFKPPPECIRVNRRESSESWNKFLKELDKVLEHRAEFV